MFARYTYYVLYCFHQNGGNKQIIVPLYNVAISIEVKYIYMQSITNFLMNLYHTVNNKLRGINLMELIQEYGVWEQGIEDNILT
jgi:hypothetical protein